MTLIEWAKANNALVWDFPDRPGVKTVGDTSRYPDRPGLWHLSDYLVSSVVAGTIFLIPRPTPAVDLTAPATTNPVIDWIVWDDQAFAGARDLLDQFRKAGVPADLQAAQLKGWANVMIRQDLPGWLRTKVDGWIADLDAVALVQAVDDCRSAG